jgi:hypothetical protein
MTASVWSWWVDATLKSSPEMDFMVELRRFAPQLLPAEIPLDLQIRSVSFRFVPARYLRFRSRVLTASRAATDFPELPVS